MTVGIRWAGAAIFGPARGFRQIIRVRAGANGFERLSSRQTWQAPGASTRAVSSALLLALGLGIGTAIPAQGDQGGCEINEDFPDSFVGSVSPCDGLLVISQSDFTGVGGSASGSGSYRVRVYDESQTTEFYTVDRWYTGNITSMRFFFEDADTHLDGAELPDISHWDTSKVTDMTGMFQYFDEFNQDIGSWDVSSVIDMEYMFKYAHEFNQDIGSWDVSSVADMDYMFERAYAFNQDLSGWDVSDLNEPTWFNSSANEDWVANDAWQPQWGAIPAPDFSPAQDATDVALDADLVLTFSENVEEGSGYITLYEQEDSSEVEQINISSSQVTFANDIVTIDPSSDLIGSTTYYVTIDDGAIISAEDSVTYKGFDDTSTWSFATVPYPALDVALSTEAQAPVAGEFEVEVAFSRAVTDFEQADIDHENGTISNFSGSGQNYTFDVKPEATGEVVIEVPAGVATDAYGVENSYAELVVSAEILGPLEVILSTQELQPVTGEFEVEVVFSRAVSDFVQTDVDHENATIRNFTGSGQNYTFDVTPVASGNVTLSVPENVATDTSGIANSAAELVVVADLDAVDPGNCEINDDTPHSFVGSVSPCTGLLVVSQTDFDAVGSSASGGDGSFVLTKNGEVYTVDEWYTGNIEDMSYYFESAQDDLVGSQYYLDGSLTDITEWDTGSVTDMSYMFAFLDDFNQDLGDWNLENVTSISLMFYNASAFNGDIGDWNVGKVTHMQNTFTGAASFNQDIGKWNVSSVINMWNMFQRATSFNQDLSGWDVSDIDEEPAGFNTDANEDWVANDAWQPQWGQEPPLEISHYSPVPDASNVAVDAALVLGFNGTVQAGSGSIKIYDLNNASSPFVELPVGGDEVTFSDDTVTMTPQEGFTWSTTYYVTIDSGALVDIEGTAFEGIDDTAQWQFTTTPLNISLTNSTVRALSETVSVDGWTTIEVNLEDTSGNAVTGMANEISGSVDLNGASFIGDFSVSADDPGLYVAGLESTLAGEATVTIDVAGTQLSDTATVTFFTVPAAPTNFSVTPGDGNLELAWDAPDDGGSAISHYEYKLTQAGETGSYVSTNSTALSARLDIENGVAYSVSVRAVNAAGSGGESAVVTVPSVTLSTDAGDVVAGAFTVEAVFSHSVTGFDQDSLSVDQGSVGTVSGSGTDYSFEVTPDGDADVTVSVPAGVALSSEGQGNTASSALVQAVDGTGPVVESLARPEGEEGIVNGPFTVRVEFNEPVQSFGDKEMSITQGSASNFVQDPASELIYTFEVTPDQTGQSQETFDVTMLIDVGAVEDALGNGNAQAASLDVAADLTRPKVTNLTAVDAEIGIGTSLTVSVAFSEDVGQSFTLDDLSHDNVKEITNFTGTNDYYQFEVTPEASGEFWVEVGEGVAADLAGNLNEGPVRLTRTADLERPGLTLEADASAVVEGVVDGPFTVTAEFDEPVTSFDSTMITTTSGANVGDFQTLTADQRYQFTVTPTQSGNFTVYVAADEAFDPAGNGNEASNVLSLEADSTLPTLGLSSDAANPLKAAFLVTATFSEPVTGFEASEVNVTRGEVQNFTAVDASDDGFASVYTFDVAPLDDGSGEFEVLVNVPGDVAQDGLGNPSAASTTLTRTIDLVPPSVIQMSAAAGPFGSVFNVEVIFSESVDFELGHVTVTPTDLVDLEGLQAFDGNTKYTFNAFPKDSGEVTFTIAAGVISDQAGNTNTDSAQLDREVDISSPQVILSRTDGGEGLVGSSFSVTAEFTEVVVGFEEGDIDVGGGAVEAGSLASDDQQTYVFVVVAAQSGEVSVQVPAEIATDLAGNDNLASQTLTVTANTVSDVSASLSLEQGLPDLITQAFEVTATFSSAVTNFDASHISVNARGSVESGSVAEVAGAQQTQYAFRVEPTADGEVTVQIEAGVISDSFGNLNKDASNTLSITADVTAPLLSLSTEATGTIIAPFIVEAGFSEDVEGFDVDDVQVEEGTVIEDTFTSLSPSDYSFEVQPETSGEVVVKVAAGAANDDAGHTNAAASLEVMADVDVPTVSLSTTAAQPVVSTFSLSAVFSESVVGFSAAGIRVVNGDLVAGTLASADDQIYEFEVIPSGGGDVSVQILAGAAQDGAGNPTLASDELTLTTDADVSGLEFVASQTSLDLSEGSSQTLSLALGIRPSGEVSLGLASSNTSVVTVSDAELIFAPDDWNVAQTVIVTAQQISGNADASASLVLVATGAEFEGFSDTLAVTVENSDGLDEDTGALATSIATSEIMGSQLGELISDAIVGGLSRTPTLREGDLMENGLPGGNIVRFAQQPQDPNYRRLHVLSARDGDQGFSLVDWFSVGLSSASVDAQLQGSGTFAYAMIGREMSKAAGAVSGLLYGVEASSWDYEAETDVDRAGVSVGYYGAWRNQGLVYTGSTTLTLSQNDFVTASGATGEAGSYRLILKGGVSGAQPLGGQGGLLKPYVDLMYASEQLEAFTFSDGTTSAQSTADVGRFGVGLEYATAPSATGNQFLVRGELSQVFGADDLTLSDGETYSPNEAPVGSVTFGWISRSRADSIARIELTFGELGNDEAEEIRLDGTLDRSF